MKLELNYDPVKPETTVCIDGKMTDPSDIYGFLYPVRNCLLQAWLLPSGSWSGLAWQLKELSRGEEIELLFVGRPEDYEDLRTALADTEHLTLAFQPDDPLKKYALLFSQMDRQLDQLLDESAEPSRRTPLEEIFPDLAEAIKTAQKMSPTDWLRIIATEEDFIRADQDALCCCLVRESYLSSYEQLEKLNTLTRSMRRSHDMICCCLEDPEKRADFAYYASQYVYANIRFDSETSVLPIMEQKYGKVYAARCTLRKYEHIANLLNHRYESYDSIKEQRNKLASISPKTIPEARKFVQCKETLNWFDRKRPCLTKLNQLATNRIPDDPAEKE